MNRITPLSPAAANCCTLPESFVIPAPLIVNAHVALAVIV